MLVFFEYHYIREKNNPFYERKKENLKRRSFLISLFTFAIKWKDVRGMLENAYKTALARKLKRLFPGCIVVHLDPTEIQGIPDLLILYENKWAALEGKKSANESHRPNQDYYVDLMNRMSFAAFIFPENEKEILNGLYQTFRS